MADTISHILPVLVLIALGYGLRRGGLLDDGGRIGVEKLTYYVLFPALIVLSLATTDFAALAAVGAGLALVSALVTMALICLVLRPLLARRLACDGPAFTSLFQGATRWNTFIGLAVAGSLFGADGLALISVAIVAIVPMANLLSVVVLARHASRDAPSVAGVFKALLRNPFIWACAVGIILNLIGSLPPAPLTTAMEIAGRGAVATGLIAVGAGLDLAALRRPTAVLLASTALKLVVMPLIGLAFALIYGVDGTALGVTIIALSVPTATNAYVLAREMNGDAPLMAEIITFQTAAAMLTMPLWIALVAQ